MNKDDLKTTMASAADEAKAEPVRWSFIDWEKVECHVSRLQSKIAKASAEGRKEDGRRLQRQLTHSFDAKLLAVRRVTTNKGKNTPGVNGELWNTPAKKIQAAISLTSKGYKAKPLRRVHIPKKGKQGETRPLGIPTMYDRAMQALYALALEPVAETTGDRHSFGFRTGRSTQDAGIHIFNVVGKERSPKWVLEGDIKGCFDHISHKWLLANVSMNKNILRQFLKAGYMEQGSWHNTDEGTPQGGIISPILANMALDGLDHLLDERYHCRNGHPSYRVSSANKVNLIRYADDFIITATTEERAKEIKSIVVAFLSERGLKLSETKTLITHIEDGFDFLGWNFRKYGNGKLIIKPARKSIQAFLREIHRIILRECRTWKQDNLIKVLTPKIRGFANYHRHVCSSKTFARIDYCIYKMLKRWAKRRHPDKGKRWLYRRYWKQRGNRHYVFTSGVETLPFMTWQHIVRHPSLKLSVNPFLDPIYYVRRTQRLRERNANSFRPAAVTT